MNKMDFQRLPAIEEEEEMDKLEVGDFFLYGKSMINQKQSKAIGQPISYYQIISKNGPTISYGPVFDTLEDGGKEDGK